MDLLFLFKLVEKVKNNLQTISFLKTLRIFFFSLEIPFLLAFTTRDHIDEFLYSIFTSVPKEHTAYSLIKEPYVIKKINAKKLVDLYQTENISFVQGIAFNFLPSFKHIEKEYICILLNGNKVQVIRNKQKVPQNQKKNKDEKVDSDKKQEHVETF